MSTFPKLTSTKLPTYFALSSFAPPALVTLKLITRHFMSVFNK